MAKVFRWVWMEELPVVLEKPRRLPGGGVETAGAGREGSGRLKPLTCSGTPVLPIHEGHPPGSHRGAALGLAE